MKPRVVIIGQGYTGRLSIVRSVAGMGCDITLIVLCSHKTFARRRVKIRKPLDAYSKYVGEVFYSENYNDTMLMDILLNHCVCPGQKNFIIPDNDYSAAAVDRYRDRLSEYFYCPNIHEEAGAVEAWMDKVRQKTLAKQLGLNVVNSVLIEIKNRQYLIPDSIQYPCFVKPLLSINGGKSALKKCNSEKALRNHIANVLTMRDDVDILVEEFKSIEKEYATLGFSDGEEVIIPGLLELLKIGHGSHFGVAVQGRVFPTTGFEDLVGKFKRMVQEIGFVGIFDFDFFMSGGEMYFCELNLRFGGSGYAFTRMGVNLPVMMMKFFRGESLDGLQKTISGEATYFNERMAMDDWYLGYISTEEFCKTKAESDIRFIESADDPVPQEMLEKEYKIKRIKRVIKQCLGMKYR